MYSHKPSAVQHVSCVNAGWWLTNGFEQNVNTKDGNVRYWQGDRK